MQFVPSGIKSAICQALSRLRPNWLDVAESAGKRSIVFFGGNFITNGITSSFSNLLLSIDRSKYVIFLVVDGKEIGIDTSRRKNFAAVRVYCDAIYHRKSNKMNRHEKDIFNRIQRGDEISAADSETVDRYFHREAARLFGKRKFDIAVEFNGYSPYWAYLFSSIRADRRVIYQHSDLFAEADNPHPYRARPRLNSVFRRYRFFDAIVSVSPEIMAVNFSNLGHFYRDQASMKFCRNPIVPSLIRDKSIVTNADNPQGNDFIEHTCNTIRFISIGRLSPEKNQSLLIEAFSRVVAGGINASLTIVGDGPLRRELESLAGNLGVSKKTFFAGMLENPFPLLRRSHCLVLPSDYEGQGLVLLEALTLGVFCIGTNIPAVRAILTNSAGIVADPTSKALAEKMIEFSRNPRKAVYEIDEYAKSAMQDFYRNVCGEGVNNAG